MWHDYYGDVGWGGWLLMGVAMLAFWVPVVLAIAYLFRGGAVGGPRGADDRTDPRLILDQRFARGEIDAVEYEERMAALEASRAMGGR